MNMSEKLSYQGAAHEDCMNKITVWTRLAVWKTLNLLVIHINICMYIQQNSSRNNEHKNLNIFKQKPICVFFDIFIDICKYVYSNKCVYKEIKNKYIEI